MAGLMLQRNETF